jgi:Arc/MetJ family transcription regulator
MGRTNIDIDDDLINEAMKATGLRTKKAVVEAGLEILARRERLRQVIRDTAGIWADDAADQRHVAEDGSAFRHKE